MPLDTLCRVLIPLSPCQDANPCCLQQGFCSHLKVLLIWTVHYPSLTMQVLILLGYLSTGNLVHHARISSCYPTVTLLAFPVTSHIVLVYKTQYALTSFTAMDKQSTHKTIASSTHYSTRCQLHCHRCIPQWRVTVLQPCTLKSFILVCKYLFSDQSLKAAFLSDFRAIFSSVYRGFPSEMPLLIWFSVSRMYFINPFYFLQW